MPLNVVFTYGGWIACRCLMVVVQDLICKGTLNGCLGPIAAKQQRCLTRYIGDSCPSGGKHILRINCLFRSLCIAEAANDLAPALSVLLLGMWSESSLAKNLFCICFFLASAGGLTHEKLNLNIPVNW